jgi:hypothetical protein
MAELPGSYPTASSGSPHAEWPRRWH